MNGNIIGICLIVLLVLFIFIILFTATPDSNINNVLAKLSADNRTNNIVNTYNDGNIMTDNIDVLNKIKVGDNININNTGNLTAQTLNFKNSITDNLSVNNKLTINKTNFNNDGTLNISNGVLFSKSNKPVTSSKISSSAAADPVYEKKNLLQVSTNRNNGAPYIFIDDKGIMGYFDGSENKYVLDTNGNLLNNISTNFTTQSNLTLGNNDNIKSFNSLDSCKKYCIYNPFCTFITESSNGQCQVAGFKYSPNKILGIRKGINYSLQRGELSGSSNTTHQQESLYGCMSKCGSCPFFTYEQDNGTCKIHNMSSQTGTKLHIRN
jgi:hypothetical protein